MASWFGWARVGSKWERLTGPHLTLGEAARALTDELRRRGLRVRSRDQALTSGAAPPRDVRRRAATAPDEEG
jgi:hypothetical protein